MKVLILIGIILLLILAAAIYTFLRRKYLDRKLKEGRKEAADLTKRLADNAERIIKGKDGP
jgi:uncharacterized protein YneF (UPF0154 family)